MSLIETLNAIIANIDGILQEIKPHVPEVSETEYMYHDAEPCADLPGFDRGQRALDIDDWVEDTVIQNAVSMPLIFRPNSSRNDRLHGFFRRNKAIIVAIIVFSIVFGAIIIALSTSARAVSPPIPCPPPSMPPSIQPPTTQAPTTQAPTTTEPPSTSSEPPTATSDPPTTTTTTTQQPSTTIKAPQEPKNPFDIENC